MAKIFETRFNKGSLIDKFNNQLTISGTGSFERCGRGIGYKVIHNTVFTLSNIITMSSSDSWSIIANLYNVSSTSGYYYIMTAVYGKSIAIILTPTTFTFANATGTYVITLSDTIITNKYNQIIITADGININIYVNSVLYGTSITTNTAFTVEILGNALISKNSIHYDYIMHNTELTTAQITKEYSKFTKRSPLDNKTDHYKKLNLPKLSDDGIVGEYDFKSNNNKVSPIRGSYPVGDIEKLVQTATGLQSNFKGYTSINRVLFNNYIINSTTTWTVACRFSNYYYKSGISMLMGQDTSKDILLCNGANGYFGFRDDNGAWQGFDGTGNTVAVKSDTLNMLPHNFVMSSDGTYIHLTMDGIYRGYITPGDKGSDFRLQQMFQAYTGGQAYSDKVKLEYLKAYDTYKDEAFGREFHNHFAKQIVFKEDLDTALVGKELQGVGSGCSIIDITVDDPVLDNKIGDKEIQIPIIGGVGKFVNWTDGTISFDIVPQSNANSFRFQQLNSDTYFQIAINVNAAITFDFSATSLFYTANNYVTVGTRYNIKIEKSPNSEFVIYIKGGTFGNEYVVVNTSGGYGVNPLAYDGTNESGEIYISGVFGTKFSNIKMTQGIVQPSVV